MYFSHGLHTSTSLSCTPCHPPQLLKDFIILIVMCPKLDHLRMSTINWAQVLGTVLPIAAVSCRGTFDQECWRSIHGPIAMFVLLIYQSTNYAVPTHSALTCFAVGDMSIS